MPMKVWKRPVNSPVSMPATIDARMASHIGRPFVIITAQTAAPVQIEVPSDADGYVSHIAASDVGMVSMHLGGGRATKEDVIDLSVGVLLHKKTLDTCFTYDCKRLTSTFVSNNSKVLRIYVSVGATIADTLYTYVKHL